MNRKILLLSFTLLQYTTIFSQHRIEGTVTDSIGAPIDAAVVMLINPDNGNALLQQMTSTDGKYNMHGGGNMRIYISCLGFKPYTSETFRLDKDTVLPDICLCPEDFALKEVVVTGEKQSPSIRIEKGKMIFTPQNSSTMAGSTALEVLKKRHSCISPWQYNHVIQRLWTL